MMQTRLYLVIMDKGRSSLTAAAAGIRLAPGRRIPVGRAAELDGDLIEIVQALAKAAARADHRKMVAGDAASSTRSLADEEDRDLRPLLD